MLNPSVRLIAALLAACVLAGAGYMAWQLHSMAANLDRMSTRMDALERMDSKLSVTNGLLHQTNSGLAMLASDSSSANRKLGNMQTDLSTMSHKISGSFLFRGVK
jgi:hypothetical protein